MRTTAGAPNAIDCRILIAPMPSLTVAAIPRNAPAHTEQEAHFACGRQSLFDQISPAAGFNSCGR